MLLASTVPGEVNTRQCDLAEAAIPVEEPKSCPLGLVSGADRRLAFHRQQFTKRGKQRVKSSKKFLTNRGGGWSGIEVGKADAELPGDSLSGKFPIDVYANVNILSYIGSAGRCRRHVFGGR
ncbi:hypothetical protein M8R20_01415 [Pseudomonas sp. R2.Fl]|nr:hypothetical protein [Pseudomonas sp. R2.Fl]